MRILLIDDEQFYFKLIRKSLKEAEYQLEYANSGAKDWRSFHPFNLKFSLLISSCQKWMDLRSHARTARPQVQSSPCYCYYIEGRT
jgi:DNA-binding response OmpR family regulator